jgi:hypothetical protein
LGKTTKRPLMPLLLIGGGILILIIAAASVLYYSRGGQPVPGDLPNQEIPYPNISRVDLITAKQAFDSNRAVFVDVRDQMYYESGHIPGALSIPLSELGSRVVELDPNDWIILYCT